LKQLVLATNNPGKIRELGELLGPLSIALIPQSSLNIPEAAEPHSTFIENALAKARNAAQLSGLPVLAEDSGICVDALRGLPGVHSARFAGEPKSDARNNQLLLERLADCDDRAAHYHCVAVLMRHADDPEPLIGEGQWRGEILRAPRGRGGFGYDSLFLDLQTGLSGAELTSEQKNGASHRGQALRSLVQKLTQIYGW
jgi:XTP/dITP diphosphohydrolase